MVKHPIFSLVMIWFIIQLKHQFFKVEGLRVPGRLNGDSWEGHGIRGCFRNFAPDFGWMFFVAHLRGLFWGALDRGFSFGVLGVTGWKHRVFAASSAKLVGFSPPI